MRACGLSEQTVLSIVRNAPVRYKVYTIPKRHGGRRVIAHPARELKLLQRSFVVDYLSKLPVHPTATAYRKGISIRDNALAHASNGPLLKFDFKEFFPSIIVDDWYKYCYEAGLFPNKDDLFYSGRILFHRKSGSRLLRLAIGAPSSPILSNILMYRFDDMISTRVAEDQVTYTRYADDLTFSARRTGYLTRVERTLREVIRNLNSPSLLLNDEKTVLATTKFKRMVTGLIITNDKHVSIGRDRKRLIRAALHHAASGRLNADEVRRLGGFLAFTKGVEPEFYNSIISRYGEDFVAGLQAVA